MCASRALVGCVVLSLQDACVFYPCCKGCFSRVDVELQATTRCSKCGYSCKRELVEYRYRLSLRVTRESYIFGVTVFGSCLNPFFGIQANGLQRMVENSDGPVGASSRSTLLLKAVEDCFIGRHFIFGIKVTGTDRVPWLGSSLEDGSSSKRMVYVVASQMFLPKAPGLGGCTVVSYYRVLLQKAAEYDPSKSSRPPVTALLLLPCPSPSSSFNNVTLCSSGLFSKSLLRSKDQDCTLTPTPPWQQSLGLVTSSAEQEEDRSTQVGEDENREGFKTPYRARRSCSEDHRLTEMGLSRPLSFECSSYNHPSFAKYPHSSVEKAVGDTPIFNNWFSPSPAGHNSPKTNGFPNRSLGETFLPNSPAWEDLPFSESLTEFLCEEKNDFDIETEPRQREMAKNKTDIRSQERQSRILLDTTNTQSGGDRHDVSDQIWTNPAERQGLSQERNIPSYEREDQEEQLDSYNCSADLFSGSFTVDTHSTHVGTENSSVLCKPDKQRSERAHVPHSTPNKLKRKSKKCSNRDSLVPSGAQELDFIPPSQSTPIVKAVASRSSASSYGAFSSHPDSREPPAFHGNLHELDHKRPARVSSFLCKLNSACVGQCGRESTTENVVWRTPSRRRSFWKSDGRKRCLLDQQQRPRVQRGGKPKCDSSECDVDSKETAVPPTPAEKAQLGVKLMQTVDEGSIDGSYRLLEDENEACDWSRDLFSDSV